ncbi:small-conductance mechanosensitive channel [Ereboglobus sp. PH5-10]|uniref:hypothetical protein n=1 Tax=Ereboglobus sp. PH5-10 TaxID=2940629 RepID=UPI002406EFD2|nr:hypothetical protein [Ereboglobus sp. PH5-10]MDF9827233.1 small-conductance mechanosensitive channel [Ereboglobus sp. PH5-10]
MKYYFYWYCFISKIIGGNVENKFRVELRSVAALTVSLGAWGALGLVFLGDVLKCSGTVLRVYFSIYILLFILTGIINIIFLIFKKTDHYYDQIDEMRPKKKRLLWLIYSFLSFAPFVFIGLFLFLYLMKSGFLSGNL